MAPIKATYQRMRIAISSMKKPTIIMNSRLAGEGSPSPITVLSQLNRSFDG